MVQQSISDSREFPLGEGEHLQIKAYSRGSRMNVSMQSKYHSVRLWTSYSEATLVLNLGSQLISDSTFV